VRNKLWQRKRNQQKRQQKNPEKDVNNKKINLYIDKPVYKKEG
jgi:hypothetical protein